MKRRELVAEIADLQTVPASYLVEAIDMARDGEIESAIFSGREAKERALEYAASKYVDHRLAAEQPNR
jgi:hypothetical protein